MGSSVKFTGFRILGLGFVYGRGGPCFVVAEHSKIQFFVRPTIARGECSGTLFRGL